MQSILNTFSKPTGLSANLKSDNHKKAVEAAAYLIEVLDDALDYSSGELKQDDGRLELEVAHLGTKFSISINFKQGLQLHPNFNTGIVQTECAKIRHFVEDLECYLKVAYGL